MQLADVRLSAFRFDFEINAVADFQEREMENYLQRIEIVKYADLDMWISLSLSRNRLFVYIYFSWKCFFFFVSLPKMYISNIGIIWSMRKLLALTLKEIKLYRKILFRSFTSSLR